MKLARLHGSGYSPRMVKSLSDPSALREEAFATIQKTLGRAGEILEHQWVGRESGPPSDPRCHLCFNLRVEKGNPESRGKVWQLRAIIKSVVHPREARQAIWNLKRNPPQDERGVPIYPLLIAPYISDSVAAICQQEGIGWLDLGGNCELEFGGLWFRVETPKRVHQERRILKSLFTPKASRVLRVLMLGPLRGHKTEDLAGAAGVSLALVSKVRKHLIDQALAKAGDDGLRLTDPGALLADWLATADFEKRVESRDYSLLDYDAAKVAGLLADRLNSLSISHAFTQWFAGWLRAPYTLPPMVSVYVEDFPDDVFLRSNLGARRVSRHEGRLRFLKSSDHQGVTIGQQEVKGFKLVSDVQIYLDLAKAGLRGDEQAEELRNRDDFAGGWQ